MMRADGAQRLRERVHLRLVLAVGAHPLPGEGDGVEADAVGALVREEADDVGELDEHVGVRPVEVPLPLVEGGPHPAVQRVVPGEVARGERGEDLGERRLVLVGDRAVGVDEEVVAVAGVTGLGLLGPRMLARDVVEHEVEGQRDAGPVQVAGEVGEVVHRAEVGPHRPVVHDRVAAVVGARARGEQRHQVQVGDAQARQVVDALPDALQVAREQVGVGDVPDRVGRLEPVGPEHALAVALAQRRRSGRRGRAAMTSTTAGSTAAAS